MNNSINILPEGWFTPHDIAIYKALVEQVVPENGVMVELGVWKGRSLCSVAEVIKRKNIHVYAVDTFQGTENEGDAHAEAKKVDLKEVFAENLKRAGILDNVTILEGRTDNDEFIKRVLKSSPSLLFIDADHSTESVIADCTNWVTPLADKNPNLVVAGHDYSWRTVRSALNRMGILDKVYVKADIWSIGGQDLLHSIFNKINEFLEPVTVVVCTKDRYFTTLPLTIQAIVQQTKQPEYLLIYDDSDEKVDLLQHDLYHSIFLMLDNSNIDWKIIPTDKKGQTLNHQQSFIDSKTDLIWRVDDDLIPDNNVLQELYFNIGDGVVGVGSLIKTRGMERNYPMESCSSLMKDIFDKPNLQMGFLDSPVAKVPIVEGVEHLHCSFLYDRKGFDGFPTNLSRVGHREETLFSMQAIKKGYKLAVLPYVSSYHLKYGNGGIRSEKHDDNFVKNNFQSDEAVFLKEFKDFMGEVHKFTIVEKPKEEESTTKVEEALVIKRSSFYFLNNGLGDHYAFLNAIGRERLDNEDVTIACAFVEPFKDLKCKIVSIEQGLGIIQSNNLRPESFDIYKFMWDNNWKGTVLEAFVKMYESNYNISVSC